MQQTARGKRRRLGSSSSVCSRDEKVHSAFAPHRVSAAHGPAQLRVRADAADALAGQNRVEDVLNHQPNHGVGHHFLRSV